jgi:phosphohistidine phosphatase SixA
LAIAIAYLASSVLPGLAAAGYESLPVNLVSCAPLTDTSVALVDSAATPQETSTAADTVAADTVRTARKEFPRPDSTLVPRLSSGGYLIVFRHSITDWTQRDADVENFEDRSTQRNLSKEGDTQAALIGRAIADLRIPIGTVLSSPMWRCRDTAQIAFGQHQAVPELFRRGSEYRAIRIALLSTVPEGAKNMVLVTHQDLLIPIVRGLRRDQLKEGDAFVVKPLGEGGFEIVAQVTPEDWQRLAADGKVATAAKDGKAAKKSKETAKK